MTSIKTFEKKYTRDYSMIIEEAWYYALTKGIKKKLKIEISKIHSIFYLTDGVIEIWEDTKAMDLFMTKFLEAINASSLKEILEEYQHKKLELLSKEGNIKTLQDLMNFIENMFEIMVNWAILYLTGIDPRFSAEIQKITSEFRSQDSFFDDCDKIIRNSLIFLYPHLKSYETTLVVDDLETKIPDLNTLITRKENFIVIPGEVKKIITLTKFTEINPNYYFKFYRVDSETTEIKGQTAFAGKVEGKVKIIKRKEQMVEMKKGLVLVTPMTTPEYVPIMEKAIAIITDEGGMLCHAAIVSRELHIPCIVGTSIATQVLKNGMEVEVDATKGIIKIIKK